MQHWLHLRLWVRVTILCVLVGLALPGTHSLTVTLPRLFTSHAPPIYLTLMLPLGVSFALSYAVDRTAGVIESLAVVPVRLYDVIGVLIAIAGTAVAALAMSGFDPTALTLAGLRNAIAFTGAMLLVGTLWSTRIGGAAVAVWAVVASIVGRLASDTWGFVVQPGTSAASWAGAVLLLLIGLLVYLQPVRRPGYYLTAPDD